MATAAHSGGSHGAVASALELYRLSRQDAGLSLLARPTGYFAAAVLGAHLGGQVRRLAVVDLHERIEEDLLALRAAGLTLDQSAQAYCDEWRRSGILVRSTAAGGREEIYELSASAEAALRYIAQVERPRAAVTQSRLETISQQLAALARDTDPSREGRLAALRAEREALDAAISRVESGREEPLDPHQVTERLTEILSLAEQIPGDFARVRAELTALNRTLREQIIAIDGSRGEVLDDIFRGVDRIDSSEAGRSFLAFHRILSHPEGSALLDDHLDAILDRDVASTISDADRRFLRHWRDSLTQESSTVRSTMTGFSRSLRSFVRSRAFEEHRRLRDDIRKAQIQAARLARTGTPHRALGLSLGLTGLSLASIGSWRLHNPADRRVTEELITHEIGNLDLDVMRAVVRQSEVDMAELEAHIADTLATRGIATIGDVLTEHPATQGIASVLGLLFIAHQRGTPATGTEEIFWTTTSGIRRHSTIPRLLLTQENPS